jgi:archaellum biogenesis ATPase FlaH
VLAPDDNTRCLKDLRITDPRDDKVRIEQTKGGLLEKSYLWILDNADFRQWRDDPQSRLLWIKGDPGKGKTMLLCGIINELSTPADSLLSFFFCQSTDSQMDNATAVLRGLIYLLLEQQPLLLSHVRKKYDHAGRSLFEDANAWVALSDIFRSILGDPNLKSTYLIIDALDECATDLPDLLEFIAQESSSSSRVKWIVSSRNWPKVEEHLETAAQKVRLCLELNVESVSNAVSRYIQHKVDRLAQRKKYDNEIRHAVQEHLSKNANDTFLWVALVCQKLEKTFLWNTLSMLKTFPPGLDSLYKRMIEQIYSLEDVGDIQLCKGILALVTTVYRPTTVTELVSLDKHLANLHGGSESLYKVIELCGSFLTIRESVVYFVHQSAKEYLIEHAKSEIFPHGHAEVHRTIVSRSLEAMSTLQKDIYNLQDPGYSIEEVKSPDPDPLTPIRYACVYWVDHLCEIESGRDEVDLGDKGKINVFLKKHFLYWLEALSLMRSMSSAVTAIKKLENLLDVSIRSYATDVRPLS